MQISARNEFAADPARVYDMLTDTGFLTEAAKAAHARSADITVDGPRTHTTRVLEAPQQARRFTGETITISEDVTWSDPDDDGARTGTLELTSPGLPVQMSGHARLYPVAEGTIVEYTGDFSINIPFMGKKLEQQASPAIIEALAVQQSVGNDWLSREG